MTSKESLKAALITELKARGFVTTGEFAQSDAFCDAIAAAVVKEIKKAQVMIAGGSSAGSYKVQ